MYDEFMNRKHDTKRRWGTEQRLEFIEFRLYWEGTLNRADITDRFGVSTAQASADLALYKERAPENLDYDSSQKHFLASTKFRPRIFQPNADHYLMLLKAIADGVISDENANVAGVPAFDAMPIPHRRVDSEMLRRILQAIRNQRGLKVYYHSMNSARPLPLWREITPHAFAFDGLRWRVRADCHLEQRFKDFILSRLLDLGKEVVPEKFADDDVDWQTFFDVVLIPNPKLAPSQRETIAHDYEMTDGRVRIPVRRALLYYFNKRLRLDVAEYTDDPKESPVVVENKKEFVAALR